MAGMVLLMEIPCLLMIIDTAKLQDGRETKGHFSLKDDDIKHSNTTL
jgi:hypothetical protein